MTPTLEQLKFKTALWLWARWVPVLAWRRDLQSLIDATAPPQRVSYSHQSASYIAKRVRRATRRPFLMRDRPCLREGLLAYRFLWLAGFRPELHFGVDPGSVASDRLRAHCWVVLDGSIVLNAPEHGMVEILVVRGGPDGPATLDTIASPPRVETRPPADATTV
jgi:Transglutaminase-like superfamily